MMIFHLFIVELSCENSERLKALTSFSKYHHRCLTSSLFVSALKLVLHALQKQPPEVFYKKCILKNFAKFTGKHLCQSLFFNKVAGLGPATLLKRDSGTDIFL